MRIIGEKINSSIKSVAEAIESRDSKVIMGLAHKQEEAGASWLEINAAAVSDEHSAFLWLVEKVQKASRLPLCLGTMKPDLLKQALEIHRGKALINSINGDKRLLERVLPLVRDYQADVIAMCMDDEGIPDDSERRVEIARRIINYAQEEGIESNSIIIDPLVAPIGTNYKNSQLFLKTLRQIKQDLPGTKTVCALSNISFGLPMRRTFNQSFASLVIEGGVDILIMDPCDRDLAVAVMAALALAGRDKHCRHFLKTYRANILKRGVV